MNESQEIIWKPINHKKISQCFISNEGQVKNQQNEIIEPELRNGLYMVSLRNNNSTGKRKFNGYYIHELMQMTFNVKIKPNKPKKTKPINDKPIVDKPDIKTSKKIIRIDFRNNRTEYDSMVEAARQNKISIAIVKRCIRGEQSSHQGFKWQYSEKIIQTTNMKKDIVLKELSKEILGGGENSSKSQSISRDNPEPSF